MRLEQLQYFVTICDKRSINLASKALFVSQQTLSSALHNLEKEVGIELLTRTNRGVIPTEFGQKIYVFASRTISEWRSLVTEAHENAFSELKGELHSLATYYFLQTFMSQYSLYVLTTFPFMKTSGSIDSFENIVNALLTNRVDFAFVNLAYHHFEDLKLPSCLYFKPFITCELYAWVGAATKLANQHTISYHDILEANIIFNADVDKNLFQLLFAKDYPQILQRATFFNYDTVIAEFVEHKDNMTLDLKMGAYGFSYEKTFHGKLVSHVPVASEQFPPIYGGILLKKENANNALIQAVTEHFIPW